MGKAGRRRMGRVENIWEKQKVEDNMQKFHYFKRKMNSKASEDKKTYFAHIFIAFENSKKKFGFRLGIYKRVCRSSLSK